jgi:hypothetical protein
MKRFITLCLALSLVAPVVIGCEKANETKREITVSTPQGSTTVTTTEKVQQTGENPPPANQ